MHDANGVELAVGDEVMVPCVIKSITANPDYCNCTLETKHKMDPSREQGDSIVLNCRQTVKVVAP